MMKNLKTLAQKKFTPLFSLIGLFLVTFLAHFLWINQHEKKFIELKNQLQQQIGTSIDKNIKLSAQEIESTLKTYNLVSVFVFENQLEKQSISFLSRKNFDFQSPELAAYQNLDDSKLVGQVVQNTAVFSDLHVRMDTIPFYRSVKDQKIKIGQMTIGAFSPDRTPVVPKSPVYFGFLYKGWMIFLVTNIMMYPLYIRRYRRSIDPKQDPDHLDWLEQELVQNFEEEDTSRDEFLQKAGWLDLFNQKNLKDWKVKGEWYVKDSILIGFPWGGSIVYKKNLTWSSYELEIEGQRMAGSDGFLVLFQAESKPLYWMIGGWKNSRSEVIGYDQTKTKDTLNKDQWYQIKIECNNEKLIGFLNGKKVWEIPKKELKDPTRELGFQKGYGVGIWGSMARFQKIRITSADQVAPTQEKKIQGKRS